MACSAPTHRTRTLLELETALAQAKSDLDYAHAAFLKTQQNLDSFSTATPAEQAEEVIANTIGTDYFWYRSCVATLEFTRTRTKQHYLERAKIMITGRFLEQDLPTTSAENMAMIDLRKTANHPKPEAAFYAIHQLISNPHCGAPKDIIDQLTDLYKEQLEALASAESTEESTALHDVLRHTHIDRATAEIEREHTCQAQRILEKWLADIKPEDPPYRNVKSMLEICQSPGSNLLRTILHCLERTTSIPERLIEELSALLAAQEARIALTTDTIKSTVAHSLTDSKTLLHRVKAVSSRLRNIYRIASERGLKHEDIRTHHQRLMVQTRKTLNTYHQAKMVYKSLLREISRAMQSATKTTRMETLKRMTPHVDSTLSEVDLATLPPSSTPIISSMKQRLSITDSSDDKKQEPPSHP